MIRLLVLIVGALTLSLSPAMAQWKVGGTIAFASGAGISGAYKASFGGDAYYMFRNPDAFFKYGFNGSMLFFPGQETDVSGSLEKFPNAFFIPLSFAVRFTFFKVFTFGPDIGYGLSLNSKIPGDLYLKGIMGLDIANTVEINLFLSNVYSGENSGYTSAGGGFLIHLY